MTEQTLFESHFDSERMHLIRALGKMRAKFSNSLHTGLGFENEVRAVIQRNLSILDYVGTGEIIHEKSDLSRKNNQMDIIVQNSLYPKLVGAGDINSYLFETVSSFGEVKCCLKKDDVRKFAKTVAKIQSYSNSFESNQSNLNQQIPSKTKIRPFSFMLAGEADVKSMTTIVNWVREICNENSMYRVSEMIDRTEDNRRYFNHKFLDGIFVLNMGSIVCESFPFESNFGKDDLLGEKTDKNKLWQVTEGNPLVWLISILNKVSFDHRSIEFNMAEYLDRGKFPIVYYSHFINEKK